MSESTIRIWPARLLRWYRCEKRSMPWRDSPTPYRVWVSEIMLQQTQVATVIPYFNRFVARFPDVRSLGAADTTGVLRLWEGLGYYSRARNLQAAARLVVAESGGELPQTSGGLQALPGIGPYTAAAIASIAFGERVPVFDGNVRRVFTRFLGIARRATEPGVRREIEALLLAAMPRRAPGDFNQAIMELGAVVCRPVDPQCAQCPLARDCVARAAGTVERIPAMPRKGRVPTRHLLAAVVRHGDHVLLVQRAAAGLFGGLWEFPGCPAGKRSLRECLAVAVAGTTGVAVEVGPCTQKLEQVLSHFRLDLRVFACRCTGTGSKRPRARAGGRWIAVAALRDFPLSRAHRRIADGVEAKR